MAQGPIHSDQTRAQRHFIEEIETCLSMKVIQR